MEKKKNTKKKNYIPTILLVLALLKISDDNFNISQKLNLEIPNYNDLISQTNELFRIYNETTIEDIYISVNENSNLTEEEKEVIFSLNNLLEENPYLDIKTAKENLSTLKIVYKPELKKNNVLGIYDPETNTIEIYEDINNETLIHELLHCIFYHSDNNLPKYIIEGVTELLTNEYFIENPYLEESCYPFEITMVKILCDIVGSESVLKSYSTGDFQYVKDSMSSQYGKFITEETLKIINSIFLSYEYGQKPSSESINKMISILEKMNVENFNLEILKLLNSHDPINDYKRFVFENGYSIKPYFSKQLINEEETNLIKINKY